MKSAISMPMAQRHSSMTRAKRLAIKQALGRSPAYQHSHQFNQVDDGTYPGRDRRRRSDILASRRCRITSFLADHQPRESPDPDCDLDYTPTVGVASAAAAMRSAIHSASAGTIPPWCSAATINSLKLSGAVICVKNLFKSRVGQRRGFRHRCGLGSGAARSKRLDESREICLGRQPLRQILLDAMKMPGKPAASKVRLCRAHCTTCRTLNQPGLR